MPQTTTAAEHGPPFHKQLLSGKKSALTLIAAVSMNQVVGTQIIEGPVDQQVFAAFIEQLLV